LGRIVWIDGTSEGKLARKAKQLERSKVAGVKVLSVVGDVSSFLAITGEERWKQVVCFSGESGGAGSKDNFSVFEQFPREFDSPPRKSRKPS
jgi:hypothetical protein